MTERNQESKNVDKIILDQLRDVNSLIDWEKEKLIEAGELMGEYFSDKVATHQVRKIFSEIKRLKMELQTRGKSSFDKGKVLLLIPKLAYLAGRVNGLKPYKKVMEELIKRVNSPEDFLVLADFSDAFLAYHKFYGGKD